MLDIKSRTRTARYLCLVVQQNFPRAQTLSHGLVNLSTNLVPYFPESVKPPHELEGPER